MMAISLWQPWASAALRPDLKQHETRHWPAPRRIIGQRVAIHAARKLLPLVDSSLEMDEILNTAFGLPWRKCVPYGAIIGTAVLMSCKPMAGALAPDAFSAVPTHAHDRLFGDWTPGRFAWKLADPIVFDPPIPAKGQQGWWDTDASPRSSDGLFGESFLDAAKAGEA